VKVLENMVLIRGVGAEICPFANPSILHFSAVFSRKVRQRQNKFCQVTKNTYFCIATIRHTMFVKAFEWFDL